MRHVRLCTVLGLLAFCALLWAPTASAQGVTTGAMSGIVLNAQMQPVAGANVIAIHEPSGTSYEATSRTDGRYTIPGMRVGGPYTVTVAYTGGGGTAFEPQTKADVTVNLGVSTDVNFSVTAIAVQESVTVSAVVDPVFSSNRTGASTTISREILATIPTFSGRISDVTRLTPQAAGSGFAGQDNRMNNITVDGSSFNNSFGLGGQPGDRTGVAPISLEALEQVQVSVAPFDVRQGSFIGAGINSVTKSGTNRLSGAFYHSFRDQEWVGTESRGSVVNPGTFRFRNTGGWASGPIVKNKWFAFGNYEDQIDVRPLHSFRANRGGESATGQVSRVLESDLTALSSFLKSNFDYETGPFNLLDDETPVKRFLLRSDFNISNSSKVSFRFNYLDSFTDVGLSGSTSALLGRSFAGNTFLSFQNSNYKILENIRSGIGEWNATFGNSIANTVQAGYTTQDESRGSRGTMFPFVDIREGGTPYTSFGFEPFTVNNELRYQTFQIQDNFTKFGNRHSLTFGGYLEKYHSDNVFFGCCPQGAWAYNSLADFYADASASAANPNRTTTTTPALQFQIRWANVTGLDKPSQPLDVWYYAGYVQDEWRPRANLTVTGGVRFDVSQFENTAYQNPAADALTFRDETGGAVQFATGEMPAAKVLWSPRVGINWDVANNQRTQVRGGTGLFSGRPAYVWISNQIGNTGVLIGERRVTGADLVNFPFTKDVSRYRPAANNTGASSYALNVTDPDFKFPQVWRSNIAVDHKLPFGVVSTTEYLYAKDVNAVYYIDANLPAPQSTFSGVDTRPRWVGTPCAAAGQVGGCVTRINNATGNQVTNAYVLKNTNDGSQWSISQSLNKTFRFGLSVRGAYSYSRSYSLSDPESTAATSFSRNSHATNPNTPGVSYSMWSPGHRVFALVNYRKEWLSIGTTGISVYWDARPSTNTASTRVSYVFASDANGDGVSANDLIYVPRNVGEMNFSTFTAGGVTFTADQQAAAFDALISGDKYLNSRRGQYAERNGGSFPIARNMDLSVTQDIFRNLGGQRNAFQIRADFLNFGNLLNSNWGTGWRSVASINNGNQVQLLTNPAVDTQGRLTYRLATANSRLLTNLFQRTAGTGDVYQFQLSLRYSFN